MSRTKGHRELVAWQKAMDLTAAIYQVTAGFPKAELYGLTQQIRRAAVSVPSNLAEGHGRGGGDYKRFVGIAYGSLMEVETQVELASRLEYLDRSETRELLDSANGVARLLNGLKRRLGSAGGNLPPAS